MGLIIGVDGGGTQSIYKTYNQENRSITELIGKSINFYSIGDEQACVAFREVIAKLDSPVAAICIGSSALGIGGSLAADHPFSKTVAKVSSNYKIVSDLYICLHAVESRPAMALISGTGSMGVAEDSSGNFYGVGGWGPLLGDQGSGYHMGIRGIREAIKSHDGITPPTILVEKLMSFFHLKKMPEILNKVYNPPIEKDVIAKFAVEVLAAAEQGDKISNEIVTAAIEYLLQNITKLHRELKNSKTRLLVYGGCFQKSEFFFNLFKDKLSDRIKNIEIEFPKYRPAEVALIEAGKLIGEKVGNYE